MDEKLPSGALRKSSQLKLKRILKLRISLKEGTKYAMAEITIISMDRTIQHSLFKIKNLFVTMGLE